MATTLFFSMNTNLETERFLKGGCSETSVSVTFLQVVQAENLSGKQNYDTKKSSIWGDLNGIFNPGTTDNGLRRILLVNNLQLCK